MGAKLLEESDWERRNEVLRWIRLLKTAEPAKTVTKNSMFPSDLVQLQMDRLTTVDVSSSVKG